MTTGGRSSRSKSLVKDKAALLEKERMSPKTAGKQPKKVVTNDGGSGSVWDEPFGLAGFPKELRRSLVAVAPCLLGRENAIYDEKFIHKVVGFCNTGLLPKDVTDVHVPPELYEDDWTAGEGANKSRFPLDKCSDPVARDLFLKLYQRVYGDVPDNKAISLTFLRACVFYYQDKVNRVNWVAAVAKVITDRGKHTGNNPQKLGPPALKDQLAGIVKECARYINQHCGGRGIGGGGGATGAGSGGGGGTSGEISGDSAVRKVEQLLKEIQSRTRALEKSGQAIQALEVRTTKVEATGQELEAEDERLNEVKEDLRKKSKGHAIAGEVTKKAECDKQQRQVSKQIAANNDLWESNQASLEKLKVTLERDRTQQERCEQDLETMRKKWAAEKASQYSMKPKHPVGINVLEEGVAPNLKVDTPCGSCSHLFVANCAVPFSCGCLFHPWCLWGELVSSRAVCPRCKEVVKQSWLESWGCDGLQQVDRDSIVKKEECMPLPPKLAVRKKAVVGNTDSSPPAKVIKPRGANKGASSPSGSSKAPLPPIGPPEGPSPIAGKSGTHVPQILAPLHPIILPIPCFANRPRGSPRIEAIATEIECLGRHTNETIEARRKLEEEAANAGVTVASQSKPHSSNIDGFDDSNKDKLAVEEQGTPSESSKSSQTISAAIDACIANCLDELGHRPVTSLAYSSD